MLKLVKTKKSPEQIAHDNAKDAAQLDNQLSDMPITEQTIHHFMRRTSLDSETLNALAPRIPQFNVALREAQWAFAGIMKPVIQGD